MSLDRDPDVTAAHAELESAREDLRTTLDPLTDDDLNRSRRGGWSVGRVVQHIIQSEWHYARLVHQLRELPPLPLPAQTDVPTAVSAAAVALADGRKALLDALQGIDEDTFFRLSAVGREEYSVLSVLENVAHHDREHAAQIRGIASAG